MDALRCLPLLAVAAAAVAPPAHVASQPLRPQHRTLSPTRPPITPTARAPRGSVLVPIVFHALRHPSETTDPVTDAQLEAQVAVLNGAFASASIQFRLLRIDRQVARRPWWGMNPQSDAEQRMKTLLAETPADVLNVYVLEVGSSMLGWATFPTFVPEDSDQNGIVLSRAVLPGGSGAPYDQGDELVHHVGHYFGLLHPFQGGCYGTDEVDDTPPQRGEHFACEPGTDTCSSAGEDDVRNYMQVSDDSCRDHFTTGQGERMRSMITTYRPGLRR